MSSLVWFEAHTWSGIPRDAISTAQSTWVFTSSWGNEVRAKRAVNTSESLALQTMNDDKMYWQTTAANPKPESGVSILEYCNKCLRPLGGIWNFSLGRPGGNAKNQYIFNRFQSCILYIYILYTIYTSTQFQVSTTVWPSVNIHKICTAPQFPKVPHKTLALCQ